MVENKTNATFIEFSNPLDWELPILRRNCEEKAKKGWDKHKMIVSTDTKHTEPTDSTNGGEK